MSRKEIMNGIWKRIKRRTVGFTLVELIVVLVILSILSAVAVPSVLGFIDDSKAKECRSQVEALTADVISAKMAYEVNGEVSESGEGGGEFDKAKIDEYIAEAGDEGCCPVSGDKYIYDEPNNIIKCPKGHGEGVLSGSGKFTVAVVEDEGKRESKDEPEPEPETGNKTDEKKHEYKARIVVDSGNPDNMKPGDSLQMHVEVVEVTEEGEKIVPQARVTVEWVYPSNDCVDGGKSGSSVSAEAKQNGQGRITCEVTVTEDDGTEKPVMPDSIDVNVEKEDPELGLDVPNVSVKEGEDGQINARATDATAGDGSDYPGEVEYHYDVTHQEGDDGEVTVDQNGRIHGTKPGTCHVTVTVRDKDDPQKTTSKTVEVTVEAKETETEASPKLHLEVSPELSVEQDKSSRIEAVVEDEGNNPYKGDDVTVTYEVEVDKSDIAEVDPNTGEVKGKTPGKCDVTVTLKDHEGRTLDTKHVTVTVTEPKPSGGLFNPNTFRFWADDSGSIELHAEPEFKKILENIPPGKWYYDGPAEDFEIRNSGAGIDLYLKLHCGTSTGPYRLRYEYEENGEKKTDYVTIEAGFPIHNFSNINCEGDFNGVIGVGTPLTCTATLQPEHTTDVPIEWIVQPEDMKVAIVPLDEQKYTKVQITPLQPGKFTVQAHARCQRAIERGPESEIDKYSSVSREYTAKYAELSQIIIPSEIDVREGEAADLTVQTIPSTGIGNVSYEYQVDNPAYFEVEGGKIVGKQSTGEQRYNLRVIAKQEEGQTREATCSVRVLTKDAPILSSPALNLEVGETGTITVAISPETMRDLVELKYSVNDYRVEFNDSAKTVKVNSEGNWNEPVKITITARDKSTNNWLADCKCLINIAPSAIYGDWGVSFSVGSWKGLRNQMISGNTSGNPQVYYYAGQNQTGASGEFVYLLKEGATLPWDSKYEGMTFTEYLKESGAWNQFVFVNPKDVNNLQGQIQCSVGAIRMQNGKKYVCIKDVPNLDTNSWDQETLQEYFMLLP